mmetsp:Transcript_19762/g.39371  ORF Transcript_19762/g.39371 Transcript_19762/m.39371 type:complete len:226 (-) Transcript_19762:1810-2487(-)
MVPLGPLPNFTTRIFRDSSTAHVPPNLASRLGNLLSAQVSSTSTQNHTPVRCNPPWDARMIYPELSSGSSCLCLAASPPPQSTSSLWRYTHAPVASNPHPDPAPPGSSHQGLPPPSDTSIHVSSMSSVTSPAAYISDAVEMFQGSPSGHDATQAGEQPTPFSVHLQQQNLLRPLIHILIPLRLRGIYREPRLRISTTAPTLWCLNGMRLRPRCLTFVILLLKLQM